MGVCVCASFFITSLSHILHTHNVQKKKGCTLKREKNKQKKNYYLLVPSACVCFFLLSASFFFPVTARNAQKTAALKRARARVADRSRSLGEGWLQLVKGLFACACVCVCVCTCVLLPLSFFDTFSFPMKRKALFFVFAEQGLYSRCSKR